MGNSDIYNDVGLFKYNFDEDDNGTFNFDNRYIEIYKSTSCLIIGKCTRQKRNLQSLRERNINWLLLRI